MVDADLVGVDKRDEYTIRSLSEDDRADVERLASEGLLVGHTDLGSGATKTDPHGSGAGRPAPQSFWVVEAQGRVIGTIAMMLVHAEVKCAKQRGALKVVIESPGFEPRPSSGEDSSIMKYLRLLGFEYTRTHEQGGRAMLEFYLNLYQEPQTPA